MLGLPSTIYARIIFYHIWSDQIIHEVLLASTIYGRIKYLLPYMVGQSSTIYARIIFYHICSDQIIHEVLLASTIYGRIK